MYDKRDDIYFQIVNFQFLDGYITRRPSHVVYISQTIRFARASSHVNDFNNRKKFLTAKLLRQGYRYHKHRKTLIEKYHVSLKELLQQGISHPEFYGDLTYEFMKMPVSLP